MEASTPSEEIYAQRPNRRIPFCAVVDLYFADGTVDRVDFDGSRAAAEARAFALSRGEIVQSGTIFAVYQMMDVALTFAPEGYETRRLAGSDTISLWDDDVRAVKVFVVEVP
jgi:hypothetical protein